MSSAGTESNSAAEKLFFLILAAETLINSSFIHNCATEREILAYSPTVACESFSLWE